MTAIALHQPLFQPAVRKQIRPRPPKAATTPPSIPAANLAAWQNDFVDRVVPAVRAAARTRLVRQDPDAFEELAQAATAMAWRAYLDLMEAGKADVVYPTAIAGYAVRQVLDGRGIGGPLNTRDVLSVAAKRKRGVRLTRFGILEDLPEEMHEQLGDHSRSPVPDQAAFRIDFANWLRTLSTRTRAIARLLASGHATNEVADKFGVSSARISQRRRELAESWGRFVGEPAVA